MSPFSLKLRKVENAFIALLTTFQFKYNNAAVGLVPGKASSEKPAPLIVVYAESSKPDGDYSGNESVTVHIMVKTPLGVDVDDVDPVIASDTLTAQVFDACSPGGAGDYQALSDLLNAQGIPDFTAMKNTKLGEEASAEEGNAWVETLTLGIECAAASGI